MWMNLDDAYYPNIIEVTKRCLSLPTHPYLSEKEVDEIASVINNYEFSNSNHSNA